MLLLVRIIVVPIALGTIGITLLRTRSISTSLERRDWEVALPARSGGPHARTSHLQMALRERDKASTEWFNRFQQESQDFWMREYQRELAAAQERVARETDAALDVANQVNAAAMGTARLRARKPLISNSIEETAAGESGTGAAAAVQPPTSRQRAPDWRARVPCMATPAGPCRLAPTTAASSWGAGRGPAP